MSLGKNRYRFTSNQTLLKHAQVLYRHNRWKKNEKVKKFRALRDDADRYVFLDHKLPVSLNTFQRAPPLSPVRAEGTASGLYWYRLTNLPRNLSDAKLREAVEQWGGEDDQRGADGANRDGLADTRRIRARGDAHQSRERTIQNHC